MWITGCLNQRHTILILMAWGVRDGNTQVRRDYIDKGRELWVVGANLHLDGRAVPAMIINCWDGEYYIWLEKEFIRIKDTDLISFEWGG